MTRREHEPNERTPTMSRKRYTVYTPQGVYAAIYAPDAESAKDAVYKLTFGRISKADMTAERTA